MTKSKVDFTKSVEGILFASNIPLTAETISKMFSEEEQKPTLGEIRQILQDLQIAYQERGIELVEVASGYRFQVTQQVAPLIAKVQQEKPARYSRALLETLALIAYRQPITRGEIEDIRGVVVSTHIIKTLDEHEWIRVVGYKDVPGKPALYATTKYFLDHFGLKSLEELPPLAELQDFEGFVTQSQVNALPEVDEEEAAALENLPIKENADELAEEIEASEEENLDALADTLETDSEQEREISEQESEITEWALEEG